ncbi:hypothetical protein [Salinigranum sp. GCM10025319]|uniref:hypothetical protein n=1 Tax=Salinigranum sp. GCM10025319 TaxID=3252687 RepID=UPI0036093088
MTNTSSGGPSRRRVLVATASATGTATLAGCTALWDQTGATDVVVYNAAAERATVSITITPADAEEPHTSRTLDVPGGGRVDPVNRTKLPTNSGYTVVVSVEDGPRETFEWDDPDLELAPLYVLVDETENIKFLLQAG